MSENFCPYSLCQNQGEMHTVLIHYERLKEIS
ncbi:hypothetical protein M2401_004673 [Pseudomonas sp. JUb42]|nr:hypothetical protein [Pseudomonas sp. JUb42]